MFPIADDNSDRRLTPVVNYALLALNVLVFVLFQQMGQNEVGTLAWSAVPAEIMNAQDIVTPQSVERARQDQGDAVDERVAHGQETDFTIKGPLPISLAVYWTLITCMFLHGGWAHLGGNMLYLWIFGDNLEDALGHFRYLLFYLLTGVIATLTHVFGTAILHANPLVPLLGASGAISGVLGGYILLYPHRQVQMFIFRTVAAVPAWVAIGLWFGLQLFSTFAEHGGSGSAGVAYLAHIGGFIAGPALVKLFQAGQETLPGSALPH